MRGRTANALDAASSAVRAVHTCLERSATRSALEELRSANADVEALAEELS